MYSFLNWIFRQTELICKSVNVRPKMRCFLARGNWYQVYVPVQQWYKSVCMKNRSINCMTCHKSICRIYTGRNTQIHVRGKGNEKQRLAHILNIRSQSSQILEIKTFGLGSRTRDVCSQNPKSILLYSPCNKLECLQVR